MQQRLCEKNELGWWLCTAPSELQRKRKLRPFCAQLADEMQMESRQIGCLSNAGNCKTCCSSVHAVRASSERAVPAAAT